MISFKFPVYLASGSTRRKEILQQFISDFKVINVNVEEINQSFSNPERLTKINSYLKFLEAKKKIHSPHCLIISADTVVSFQDKIFGKPASRENAIETLKLLSNQTHSVITGVTLSYVQNDQMVVHIYAESTLVTFFPLSEENIISYVDNYRPFDKAGSYGIQELPLGFIKNIEGDFNNIVGLPSQSLNQFILSYAQ